MRQYGRQQIFNSDQSSRFRSPDFTDVLEVADIKISMNGKGRCIDNIFAERFFRTLKYTDVYLREYRDLPEVRKPTGGFIQRYNNLRPHATPEYVNIDVALCCFFLSC